MKKLYYVKMIIMHNLQKMVNVQWSMFNFLLSLRSKYN